jgi:hypothetical protein
MRWDGKTIRAVAAISAPKGQVRYLMSVLKTNLMIPGAFGSEITKDSSDDEVLRWRRGHRVATADFLHPSAGKSGSIPTLEL